MVNYYKQFSKFINQEKIQKRTPIKEFKQKMMIYFGFGGRNNTIDKWLKNFEIVNLIKLVKKDDVWYVELRNEGS